MDLPLISIAVGVGLSAACGFRVFVPLLMMSGASMLGYLELAEQFAWMGTMPALIGFGTATGVEVLAYYVPWLDNALDAIASPAAVGAGVLASASVLGDLPPFAQWTLAVIAGGGSAGLVQGGTVVTRGASSAGTGGLGNFLVSTGEAIASVVTTLLAIVAPFVALAAVIMVIVLAVRRLFKRRRRTSHR